MPTYKAPWGSYDSEDLYRLAQLGYGEARGEGTTGMAATMHVAMNRMNDSRFPDTIKDVALQRKQFSAFDDQVDKLRSAPTRDPAGWEHAVTTAKAVLDGQIPDPTGGATHYYAPRGMEGGLPPRWAGQISAQGAERQIGNHIFMGQVRPKDPSAVAYQPGQKLDAAGMPVQAAVAIAPPPKPTAVPIDPAAIKSPAATAPAAPAAAPDPLSSPQLFSALAQRAMTMPDGTSGGPTVGSVTGGLTMQQTPPNVASSSGSTSSVPSMGMGAAATMPDLSSGPGAAAPSLPSFAAPLPPVRDPSTMSVTPTPGMFDPNNPWFQNTDPGSAGNNAGGAFDSGGIVADAAQSGTSTLSNFAKLFGIG